MSTTDLILRLLVIGVSNGAILALNALAVTLVYGVVRMLNLAHGDLFGLLTVLVTALVALIGLRADSSPLLLFGSLVLVLGVALAIGMLSGLFVERMTFRPFRRSSRITPLIATIGLSFILYQAALLLRYVTNFYERGEHRSVPGIPEFPRIRLPDLLPKVNLVEYFGLPFNVVYTPKDLAVLLIALLLALGVGWFLQATRAGRMLRACAEDAEMAQLCGVNPIQAIRLVFALGGVLTGAAAFVFALYYGHPYTQYGAQSSLTAFTAAVLGGLGRPRGALLSGLVLGVAAAFSDYYLAAQWTPVLMMLLLIVAIVARPRGLSDADAGVSQATEAPVEAASGMRRMSAERRMPLILVGLLGLGVVYPLLDAALGWRSELVAAGILVSVILALGLNIVIGFAGMLDLGYAAFFGIGSYAAGIILTRAGAVDLLLLLAIGGGLAGALGLVNGLFTLRLRGEYLALTTLAFGQMVPQLARNLHDWTGGTRGLTALPAPHIFGVALQSPTARYYLTLMLAGFVGLICLRLVRSRIGRAWLALRMDDMAAVSCGIPSVRMRTLAFVFGAVVAGGAGALFAPLFSYVDPNQSEFQLSAMVLAMVVIGGAGSLPGAVLGALIVAGYDRVIIPNLGAWLATMSTASGWPLLAALDLRNLNYFWFGLALYVTVWLRERTA